MTNNIENLQAKESLRKYAQNYILRHDKTRISNKNEVYVIYARKSTEEPDRQQSSISDQVRLCKEYASKNGLTVIDIIREEKSAKTSGKRMEFRRMLDNIKKGESYNCILTWHPDRLARNMKEAGEIMDLLDSGVITNLKFVSYYFTNDSAGKMTLSILFAMAKEFSDKLSDDTKRGNSSKVLQGKYIGASKRGYIGVQDGYYRKADNYETYKNAWKEYVSGKTQADIIKSLELTGEKLSSNSISAFFLDPFYAGFYCSGSQCVDLTEVDKKFEPMVTPNEFITAQKMYRIKPNVWKKSDTFRPFQRFAICSDCGHIMTAGLSFGRSNKYLSVTCGNEKCHQIRKGKEIKPIANTIRGAEIIVFVVKFIDELLKIDSKTYNKAKDRYLNSKSILLKNNKEEIQKLKTSKTKLENDTSDISKRLVKEKDELVQERLSRECNQNIKDTNLLKDRILELEKQNSDMEMMIEDEFPEYKTFLNFFKDVATAIQSSDNAYLIDSLVKLVLLNITVSDKKVVDWSVREPFETYKNLKLLNGVADRI